MAYIPDGFIFARRNKGRDSITQWLRDYNKGGGRDKKRYQELLGLKLVNEKYQGKIILDFGAGPELIAPREIVKEYLDKGLTPPHIIAISPAFAEEGHRARAIEALAHDGLERYISPVAGYGHTLPVKRESVSLIMGVHVFQHLIKRDIEPTLIHLLNALEVGGTAVFSPLLRVKSEAEILHDLDPHDSPPVLLRELEDAKKHLKDSPQCLARIQIDKILHKLALDKRGYAVQYSPAPSVQGAYPAATALERLTITKTTDAEPLRPKVVR